MDRLGLRGLSRSFSATLGRQVAAAVLGLGVFAVIARVYGPEGNGTYAIALLLPSTLTTFLNLGVAPANVYFLGSGRFSVREVLLVNQRIALLLTLIGLVIGATALLMRGTRLFPGIDLFVLWLALMSFPLGLINGYLLSVFQGVQQFRPYNLILLVQPLGLVLLVPVVALVDSRDLSLLVAATLASQLAALVLALLNLRPLVGEEPRALRAASATLFKSTMDYGWKVHLGNILTYINYRADVFIVNLLIGPAAVGVYVVAVAFGERLWLVSQAVSTVLLPRLSQLTSDEAIRRQLTPIVARWVLALTGLAAAVLALLAGPIVALVFGSEFRGAIAPLLFLLPGMVLYSASRVLANDIAARGRPELNLYTSMPVVVVNILGNVALIPPYGLAGAALATTAAYAIDLVLRLVIYGRLSKNHWSDSLFLQARDVRNLRASLTPGRVADSENAGD